MIEPGGPDERVRRTLWLHCLLSCGHKYGSVGTQSVAQPRMSLLAETVIAQGISFIDCLFSFHSLLPSAASSKILIAMHRNEPSTVIIRSTRPAHSVARTALAYEQWQGSVGVPLKAIVLWLVVILELPGCRGSTPA